MGKDTNISWCDSTLNLQMGCDGCELWNNKVRTCYAGILTERHEGQKGWPVTFEDPMIFPKRLDPALKWPDLTGTDRPDKPHLNGYPRIIFLNDMGDTFTESLPIDWLSPFVDRMAASPHIWLILTKRPRRMKQFFYNLGSVPDNFWLGVSVTDHRTANARIPHLLELRAKTRIVSAEPLLGPINFAGLADPYRRSSNNLVGYTYNALTTNGVKGLWDERLETFLGSLDFIIVGGESGSTGKARTMEFRWATEIIEQCETWEIPVFIKQLGSSWVNPLGLSDRKGTVMGEWPEHLQRQEMPGLAFQCSETLQQSLKI